MVRHPKGGVPIGVGGKLSGTGRLYNQKNRIQDMIRKFQPERREEV